MKLELKHLAPYLPYGLKFKGKFKNWISFNIVIKTLCPIDLDGRFEIIKPILRPLSDFYNINAPAFIDVNFNLSTQLVLVDLCLGVKHFSGIPYSDMEEFFMQHIDVFDLIEQDLAISIHDV